MKKKILSGILALTLLVGCNRGMLTAIAAGEPKITLLRSDKAKVGEALGPDTKIIKATNLPKGYNIANIKTGLWNASFNPHAGYTGNKIVGGVCEASIVDRISSKKDFIVYKPGTYTMQLQIYKNDKDYDNKINSGKAIKFTVEEPEITHNAPASIQVGGNIKLTTALTNTALKNKKVKTIEDEIKRQDNRLNELAYKPVVEVIEGKDCVKQDSQDYTNTLNSSEKLSFSKAGTVKLKITYKQIDTCHGCLFDSETGADKRYNVEKIVTIKVTKPTITTTKAPVTTTKAPATTTKVPSSTTTSVPSETTTSAPPVTTTTISTTDTTTDTWNDVVDDGTGIEITGEGLPKGAQLSALQIEGKAFNEVVDKVSGLDKKVKIKTLFDLSLLESDSDNTQIHPNGKVKISIPVPVSLQGDTKRLVAVFIGDDGKATELPTSIDGDKITFETDHFSMYAIAVRQNDTSTQTDDKSGGNWWIVVVAIVVAGAGVATAVVIIKKRKNNTV